MRYLQAILLALLTVTAQAQTDSVRTEYVEETARNDTSAQRSGSRFLKVYRQFIRAQVEETTLLKIGAIPEWGFNKNDRGYVGFTSEVGVEQKLIPAFSVLAAVRTHYRNFGTYGRDVTTNARVAGRWYYGINRRIREGKSANNFSNQYVMWQTNLPLYAGQSKLSDPTTALTGYAWTGLALGAQRRLGRLGYTDVNFGMGYPLRALGSVVLSGSVIIGFGL